MPNSGLPDRTEVVRAGYLTKEGHFVRNWKRRWCVLAGQSLYYFVAEPDELNAVGKDLKGAVPLRGATITTTLTKERANTFVITNTPNRKDFFMTADSHQEAQDWMADLREAAFLHTRNDDDDLPSRETLIVLRQESDKQRAAATHASKPLPVANSDGYHSADSSAGSSPPAASSAPVPTGTAARRGTVVGRAPDVMPAVSFQAVLGTISRCEYSINGRSLLSRFAAPHLFQAQQLCALLGTVQPEYRLSVAEVIVPKLVDPRAREKEVLLFFAVPSERDAVTRLLDERSSVLATALAAAAAANDDEQ